MPSPPATQSTEQPRGSLFAEESAEYHVTDEHDIGEDYDVPDHHETVELAPDCYAWTW